MRPTDGDDKGSASDSDGQAATGDKPLLASDSKSSRPKTDSGSDTKDSESTPAEPAHERVVKFLGGKLALDVYKHPIIGSPEAPHIVIEMASYDCPHCRKMHAMFDEALAHYGDQVALLIMPIPLDRECNKLMNETSTSHPGACGTARMAIALAKLAPAKFSEFHAFLMSGDKEKPPSMTKIIPKAYTFVPAEKLRDMQRGPEVAKQLASYVDLYGQLMNKSKDPKGFGLPVQIIGDDVISGEVDKIEDVYKAWEENLHVTPK
jgi:thiol-disulfide isomerase/thioredoxin